MKLTEGRNTPRYLHVRVNLLCEIMMRGYKGIDEDLDEYEDDFIEDDEEGKEYEKKEKEQKPTKEVLNYLKCRHRLKEQIRKNLEKENGASLGNYQEEKKKLPYDGTLGNFFGPSQPVIHERVLQEHKSSLENLHLAARVPNPSHSHNKNPGSTTAGTTSAVRDMPLKHVDQVKLKAQKLKDNRDYSSLFSEDAELPVPIKGPPPQNARVKVSADRKDARSAQVSHRSKHSTSDPRRTVSDCNDRRPVSVYHITQNRPEHKAVPSNRPKLTSADSRKQLSGNTGNGPGRPIDPKRLPSKMLNTNKMPARMMDKKPSTLSVKMPTMGTHKAPLSKLNLSIHKRQAERDGEFQVPVSARSMSKQQLSMSRPQMKPPTQILSRAPPQKKRPAGKYADEVDNEAFSMLRKLTGYNSNKFRDDSDSDSDMEANFDDIQKEEARSTRVAREEDERELRLIEEEEKRRRLRLEKRRKLQ
ncbi:hypothetical protein GIB67_038528 [Kingdonia uniflora]|uniref:Protein SPT2 homolog n=1 Tax=Kingdonia uniflora TaxID=39325 RepID=A0A7J7NPB8_9MAGN|nr:hypothetical protein GIB67_038528 [Kingdonia uniflora]